MDLKKSVLILLALGLTGVATAGGFMPAPACSNHPVTVPCERTGWDFGYTAYWFQPSSNYGNLLGGDQAESIDFSNIAENLHNSSHRFGFGLEGSYHWGTGNDLNLNWTRFHHGENFGYIGEQEASVTVSKTDLDVKFDLFNLELGQMIDVGPNWDLRAHFGLSYVKIDLDAETDEATGETPGDANTNLIDGAAIMFNFDSKVKGIGPRAGFDLAYHVTDHFNLVGHSAVALYAGERESDLSINYRTVRITTPSNVALASGERRSALLGVEGKIGVAYNASMSNANFLVEGGYAVSSYRDGIDVFGVFSSPFNLDGFYVKAKITA